MIAQTEELWRGVWEVFLTHSPKNTTGIGEAAHHRIHLQERSKLIRSLVQHFIEKTGVSLLVWFQYIQNYFGLVSVYTELFWNTYSLIIFDTTGHTMGRSLSIHQPGGDVPFQSHTGLKSV
jgi:hypothetical protein